MIGYLGGLFGGKIGKHKSMSNPQALNTEFSSRQEYRQGKYEAGQVVVLSRYRSAGVDSRQLRQGGFLRCGYWAMLVGRQTANNMLGYILSAHLPRCLIFAPQYPQQPANSPPPCEPHRNSYQLSYYCHLGQWPLMITRRRVLWCTILHHTLSLQKQWNLGNLQPSQPQYGPHKR